MLDIQNQTTDETKRLLYVAMTRAKENLTIHFHGNYLLSFNAENLEIIHNTEIYLAPKELAIHLTHNDVWLDYFIGRQHLISELKSGDTLKINRDECINSNGHSLLKFSNHFLSEIESKSQEGYSLKSAKINFIVYWKKEDTAQEVKIILPELYFER